MKYKCPDCEWTGNEANDGCDDNGYYLACPECESEVIETDESEAGK